MKDELRIRTKAGEKKVNLFKCQRTAINNCLTLIEMLEDSNVLHVDEIEAATLVEKLKELSEGDKDGKQQQVANGSNDAADE